MTKSKRQKQILYKRKNGGPILFDPHRFDLSAKSLKGYEARELISRCHKNKILYPGHLNEGSTVYLMRARPAKNKRKKCQSNMWKIAYLDRENGFIQLNNVKEFDKEGAEENASFFRSHNFPITDIWNLDTVFTLFFLPRLKVFTYSTRYGTPMSKELQDDVGNRVKALSKEEWQDILVRMYEGLSVAYGGEDAESIRRRIRREHPDSSQSELWKIENEMEAGAKELFCKYFFDLWD